jgi:hypothetical protein
MFDDFAPHRNRCLIPASGYYEWLKTPTGNSLTRRSDNQLIVLRRKMHGRVQLTNNDRWFFIQLYRWFPSVLQVISTVRPETLVRWHWENHSVSHVRLYAGHPRLLRVHRRNSLTAPALTRGGFAE